MIVIVIMIEIIMIIIAIRRRTLIMMIIIVLNMVIFSLPVLLGSHELSILSRTVEHLHREEMRNFYLYNHFYRNIFIENKTQK